MIQIIGRCLRLHPNKTIANIILPFSSTDDGKNISNFLQVMAKNDTRIKKSFENIQLGVYINIYIKRDLTNDVEKTNTEIEFKYNLIYNSMGKLTNGEEIWIKKLEQVKTYIDTNNKRPSQHDKDKQIKQLGSWIQYQQDNYKKKAYIMTNEEIYNNWKNLLNDDKYKQYFITKPDRRIRIDE